MKLWHGYGTEHSMNLVMIGRFREVATAETVKEIIETLTSALRTEEEAGRLIVGEPIDRYSEEILGLLIELGIHNIRPEELEQFLYDIRVQRTGDAVVVTTDEIDVQALLKILLDKGARVEVYSKHDYPDTGKAHEA